MDLAIALSLSLQTDKGEKEFLDNFAKKRLLTEFSRLTKNPTYLYTV